jgi:hypothetical protein
MSDDDQIPQAEQEQRQAHNTSRYDRTLIAALWMDLLSERRAKTLAKGDVCPGLVNHRFDIRRQRRSLYEESIGLGMQLRFNLALELLDSLGTDEEAKTLRENLGLTREFHQLGTPPSACTLHFFEHVEAQAVIINLCSLLDQKFRPAYEWLGPSYSLTPAIFTTPFHGDEAIEDFIHLLTIGERHRTGTGHLSLMQDNHRFVEAGREDFEDKLFQQLMHKNGGRPIQCITAPGAPTGLKALARHLALTFPAKLNLTTEYDPGRRARDIYVIPCARWIRPATSRGLEYLVHHVAALLAGNPTGGRMPDMSEAELEQGIGTIRAALAERPTILIFVGFEAVTGPLSNLQHAIIDAPLVELLSHLSRPLLGKSDAPYEVGNFEWTYFLVLGLSPLDSLVEYQQGVLPLPLLENKDLVDVLEESGHTCVKEIRSCLDTLVTHISEAEVSLFEQIRLIEQARGLPAAEPFEDMVRYGLQKLTERFIDLLDSPRHRLAQAMVLLIALSITGMRRITLMRCLLLWQKAFPDFRCDPALEEAPQTTESWANLFDTWLPAFSPLLRAGPGQPWRELDPREHPFEYPDSVSFNLASESSEWWKESIDFIHTDIKHKIAEYLATSKYAALAIGIHDIIGQEALRQHTLVLRHTPPADLLTKRSYRRGLLALYHGLVALPLAFAVGKDFHFPELTGLPHQVASTPAEWFQFLYCGLFHRLLGDKSSDRMSYEWGADAIRLEVVLFAQDKFLDVLHMDSDLKLLISREMLNRHFADMAMACVRVGNNERWTQIRGWLKEHVEGMERDRQAFSSIAEQVLLHMEMVTEGPFSYDSAGACTELLQKFGISARTFHHPPWLGKSGLAELPSVAEFSIQVEIIVERMANVPQEQLQHVVSLLFLFGLMHNELCESKIGPSEFSAARLLGYLLPMIAARRAWGRSFHANSFEAAPYLMADGLRTLARLGLEILRKTQMLLQKRGRDSSAPIGAEELLVYLTTEVRDCLDEYTRDYYFHESERTHMLILESRFARTAYRLQCVQEYVQSKSSIIIDSVWVLDATGQLDINRHKVALDFLTKADQCLLRFHPSHSLRLRLLSERSSALRGLAYLQLKRVAGSSLVESEIQKIKHVARRLANLAALEVEQMEGISSELVKTRKAWINPQGSSKWTGIVAHHRKATADLLQQLLGVAR